MESAHAGVTDFSGLSLRRACRAVVIRSLPIMMNDFPMSLSVALGRGVHSPGVGCERTSGMPPCAALGLGGCIPASRGALRVDEQPAHDDRQIGRHRRASLELPEDGAVV